MATFVFENMTQAQADAITGTDIITFSATTVNARNIGVSVATQVGTGVVTLSANGKSLNFNEGALSDMSAANRIAFDDNSHLALGTNTTGETVTGSTTPNTVYLLGGDDSYNGSTNNVEDFVYGGNGADQIVGGSTASHLYGSSAAGGADGNDLITGGSAGDYIQGNAGADTLNGSGGSDRILGGAGNDVINGGSDNDSVNGNLGNDTINGDSGNDFLRGGQGNDQLTGGSNDDQLFGDLGNDTIIGGDGIDILTGGAGNDVFSFNDGDAYFDETGSRAYLVDTVTDFEVGKDSINFGFLVEDVFDSPDGATFTTVSAALVYAQERFDNADVPAESVVEIQIGSDLYLFYDANRDLTLDSVIKLNGIAAGDFDTDSVTSPAV